MNRKEQSRIRHFKGKSAQHRLDGGWGGGTEEKNREWGRREKERASAARKKQKTNRAGKRIRSWKREKSHMEMIQGERKVKF